MMRGRHSRLSDDEVSIGRLFDEIDEIRLDSLRVSHVTTEVYEKQIAGQIHDLANVVADLVVLIREHLSCHDCQVVDHTHTKLPGDVGTGRVAKVFDGVVMENDENEGR